jgi:tetratricopeptide (TPR) repeat protein
MGAQPVDSRQYAASGQEILQQALNCVQVEEISAARGLLEGWSQLGHAPSQIEQAVLFRRNLMLGRLLRFQGAFSESLARLEEAQQAARVPNGLVFDEDLRDLACELADTLRELDDPASAERLLREEMERRGRSGSSLPSSSPLDLCLAEALFAQSRLDEAESLCLEVQSRPDLLKFERLRLHITLAKIRHVRSANEEALACWGEAMKAIGKFRLTNGRTTRVIVVSICDTLSVLGHASLVSFRQVAALDELARPGVIQHWIAGLRHWLEYLRSQDRLGSA